MLLRKIIIRLILLVIVTLAFLSSFYFYFKNSRAAGSPLNDEEYMQQLADLSERYDIVSPILPTPTTAVIENNNSQNIIQTISLSVLDFLSGLLKKL